MRRLLTLALVGGIAAFTLAACESPADPMAPSTAGLELAKGPPAGTTYSPVHPSQAVSCNLVDNAISKLPKTDGDGVVTDDEVGPGGWRHQSSGRGFVTFNYDWDGSSEYTVVAGRSNTAGNAPSDYPALLNLPQSPREGQLVFSSNHGEIVLSGDPAFALPGSDGGQVRISLRRTGTDGGDVVYAGCAKRHYLTLFGFAVPEGGDFVIQSYFKAWARANSSGEVLEYEWTEIDTYKNVTDAN